jgi:hypothetical protein
MSSHQKQPAATRLGDRGAHPVRRGRPEKSKPHGELAKREAKSANAQTREQSKRANQRNIDQQGNRANVRQNTTRQGNRRSA